MGGRCTTAPSTCKCQGAQLRTGCHSTSHCISGYSQASLIGTTQMLPCNSPQSPFDPWGNHSSSGQNTRPCDQDFGMMTELCIPYLHLPTTGLLSQYLKLTGHPLTYTVDSYYVQPLCSYHNIYCVHAVVILMIHCLIVSSSNNSVGLTVNIREDMGQTN